MKQPYIKKRRGGLSHSNTTAPLLGTTADGMLVTDRFNSHVHQLSADLLHEALAHFHFGPGQFSRGTVRLNRIVGQTTCVRTGSDDSILFARRKKRAGPTRFVRNRSPQNSECVSFVLKRSTSEKNMLVLVTAFIGSLAEPEPWDPNASLAAEAFWRNHALVWGSEDVCLRQVKREWPEYWHRMNTDQDSLAISGSRCRLAP